MHDSTQMIIKIYGRYKISKIKNETKQCLNKLKTHGFGGIKALSRVLLFKITVKFTVSN